VGWLKVLKVPIFAPPPARTFPSHKPRGGPCSYFPFGPSGSTVSGAHFRTMPNPVTPGFLSCVYLTLRFRVAASASHVAFAVKAST
jgi:hypothetical protein